jgi:hypothetical protein
MLCVNCSKLLYNYSNNKCYQCKEIVGNDLSILCDKCSDKDNVCSCCLKKMRNYLKSGCSACGPKTR